MRSAWGFLRGMIQEKGSRERCSNWILLHAQSTIALFSGFPLSQGNLKHQISEVEKQSIF